jgi:GxxExxY protein
LQWVTTLDFELSQKVIGCAMSVHRELGCGFLESIYENALAIELRRRDVRFASQVSLAVYYPDELVGRYVADMVVEQRLLLELKALNSIDTRCEAQMINYLKASGIPIGLILNFGTPSLQFKRKVQSRVRSSPTLSHSST